jgi:hypothetical protein
MTLRTLAFFLASFASAQTLVTSVPKDDHSGSTETLPARKGLLSARPSTCTQGAQYFATDATAGQNIYLCSSTDTWTQVAGAASAGSTGAMQAAGAGGTFADSGCTASGGVTTCPNGFSTGTAFRAGGPCQNPSGVPTPVSGSVNYFCDSTNNNAFSAKIFGGTTVPLQFSTKRIAGYVFDGGGVALSGSMTACVDIPAAATITGITLLADQATSGATVEVTGSSYATYLSSGPGGTASITGSTPVVLTSAYSIQNTTLSGWSPNLAANSVICFNLSSPSVATWLMVDLKGTN